MSYSCTYTALVYSLIVNTLQDSELKESIKAADALVHHTKPQEQTHILVVHAAESKVSTELLKHQRPGAVVSRAQRGHY